MILVEYHLTHIQHFLAMYLRWTIPSDCKQIHVHPYHNTLARLEDEIAMKSIKNTPYT